MNPVMLLQQCLTESAMAGTNLLGENFRLKKAAESLTPLAARNPVFRKMQEDTKALFTLPAQEQGMQLLKVLSLVNAVAVTMAQTKGEEGQPLSEERGCGTYIDIPYSQMEPLIHALTGKGPGRFELIEDTFRDHREYFRDYRLQGPLLQALSDSYIASVACAVLIWLGEDALANLKDGFDSKGKRDMGYRAYCIAEITGDETFRRDVEENGSKPVREALREGKYIAKYRERLKI